MDTGAYVSVLRELTEQGQEVCLLISGNSMRPFLIHERDSIRFKKPDRPLRRGDMVFYQRSGGTFVMHRIYKVVEKGYIIVGDAQAALEGPVAREQIFGLITQVQRKGKWIGPGNFWWEFFEHIWIRMVRLRLPVMKVYQKLAGR